MAQSPRNERGRQEQLAEDVEDADVTWMQVIMHEWREELADLREDIYTLEDGEPVAGEKNKTDA